MELKFLAGLALIVAAVLLVTNQAIKASRARGRGIPETAYVFFPDGEQWCCVGLGFDNLQADPAGFGYSLEEAYRDYTTQMIDRMRGLDSDSERGNP